VDGVASPYTLLHLSLVTIGGCLAGPVNATRLVETLVAFFLALGSVLMRSTNLKDGP